MRHTLLLVGTVVLIGLLAQKGFEAAFAPEPIHPVVIDGPYSRPSNKLWVSGRQDRERRRRPVNQYLVTRSGSSASDTRRGLPPIGNNVRHSR